MGQPTAGPVSPGATGSTVQSQQPKKSMPTETLDLGVYRVIFQQKPSYRSMFSADKVAEAKVQFIKAWRLVERLIREIVSLGPLLFISLLGIKIWEELQWVILMRFETHALHVLEMGLRAHSVDPWALVRALLIQAFCLSASSVIARWCEVKYGSAHVTSLATANTTHERVSAALPWQTFQSIVKLFAKTAAVMSQMGLVLHLTQNQGIFFALISIARPVLSIFSQDDIWARPRVVETINTDYVRMLSLQALEDRRYRHDIISGNIVQYIIHQSQKARVALGDISTDYPETQYRELNFSLGKDVLTELSGILPMFYYAVIAFLRPSEMSLAMIATLQQSSMLLRWSFCEIYLEVDKLRENLSSLQEFYDLETTVNVVKDGSIAYPNETSSSDGMSFELRNVTFSYPGNDSDTDPDSDSNPSRNLALNGVSFRIEAGQLVVVVGQNGSGKSTFINLLTRMYDATSGEILVDGENIRHFRVDDLRQATATLVQEHTIFPLSIAENIGIGYPEAGMDPEMILEAAKKGGAEALVKKFDSGIDAILYPMTVQYNVYVDENDDNELAGHVKRMKKSIDISGGEQQRLVAARTFMRLNSNKIRFVAVDEPSSALDPEGEEELFNNLRNARSGRTMLFVTHRFGPITKHADKIICMKDGKVAESGTHSELMAKEGEYFKMYNIQANAFE
ncbi:hypothetical protein VNI00_006911 [Paramarasmius palmivorus]|uniref:ABC transporter domain-containing protein n=1 Tax=Paramarasmius palmivorus TaxID=297713 RepID=A0AAW0D6W7_9AGAR